jgi:hypothetical protein
VRTFPTIDFMKAFFLLLMSILFVTAPIASPARAQTRVVVSDAQAEQHLGQDVTVEGVVTAVSTSRKAIRLSISVEFTRTRRSPVGFPLVRRERPIRLYSRFRVRRSRSQEELSFIAGSPRSESYQRVRLLRSFNLEDCRHDRVWSNFTN